MALQSREDLIADLQSKKFRDAFVSSRLSNTLALQIRVMRQERGWSQAHLAMLLGTSQNAVYRLESPQYGKPSITTLKRLASIFDVGLAVWFVPFSKLVNRVTGLSTEDILVPSFEDDQTLHGRESASTNAQAAFTVSTGSSLAGDSQEMTNVYKSSNFTVGQSVIISCSTQVGYTSTGSWTDTAIVERNEVASVAIEDKRQNMSVPFLLLKKTA